MIGYRIDLRNSSVKAAMQILDIHLSDVIEKPQSAFLEEFESEELANIKYQQHLRMLKKTEELIHDFIKQEQSNSKKYHRKRPELEASYSKNPQNHISKLQQHNKHIFKTMINQVKRREKSQSHQERTNSLSKIEGTYKQRNQEYLKIQQENMSKATRQRELKEKAILKEFKQAKTPITEQSQESPVKPPPKYSLKTDDESFLDLKLAELDEKQERSTSIHMKNLKEKQELALKHLQRVEVVSKNKRNADDSEVKLIKVINKQQTIGERRLRIGSARESKRLEKQQASDHQQKAANRTLEYERKKAKQVEKRLIASQKFIDKARSNNNKSQEIKQEIGKIKTADISVNNKRMQLIYVRVN